MTSQEKDKFICEKLGVCWHEVITKPCSFGYLHRCSCGTLAPDGNIYIDRDSHKNPDFTSKAGRVQLLKMIEKSKNPSVVSFVKQHFLFIGTPTPNIKGMLFFIPNVFMANDKGLFRDTFYKWLGGEE